MGIRFLISDDHAAYRNWLGHHLTAEWDDCDVITHDPSGAGTLPEGAEARDFDVMFVDHRWDSGSGFEAVARLKATSGCPPVIMLTPQGDQSAIAEAIRAGADDVLPKGPIGHADIVGMVRAALGGGRRHGSALEPAADGVVEEKPEFSLKGHRFIRRVAKGGISSIYLMENQTSGEQVVVKVLTDVPDVADGRKDFDRFLQEYELISGIRHPNVVRIYDLGIADDHAFIVMEHFPCGDLRARITEGMSVDRAVQYLEQMAGALAAIHQVGVLHRDLKPGNVMCREDGSIALIDFGLAKRTRTPLDLTKAGEIFGTPYYMSPEQGHGAPVSETADIYSLGVIFYEMLTGRKPFAAASPMAVIYKHRHADIPKLPGEAEKYQALFASMVAKDPANRPPSTAVLVERLAVTRGDEI